MMASAAAVPRTRTGPPSRRRRRRRGPSAWQLALAGLALFGVSAGTIYFLAVRHADRPAAGAVPAAAGSASTGEGPARALSADRVQRMIDEMNQRVQQDPKDASAWALLANSYDMAGRFADSSRAHARLAELLPDDAQVLADYADALAVAQGRRFDGEPRRLLARVLKLDPKNLKALLLAGTEAFDRRAYGEAIAHWERARAVAADVAVTRQIDSGLAEARALATRPARLTVPVSKTAEKAVAGRDVSGRVSLAPALQAKASPDDTVFVFARSALGSRMPVALLRRKVRDLPLDFRLDDSMAMVPDVKLSSLSAVVVGARISRRGDAVPQSGDLQGLSLPVPVGSRGLQLQITEVLP